MSYWFWLGREAEQLMRDEEDAMFFCEEVRKRIADCRPEADGFITCYYSGPVRKLNNAKTD